MILEAKWPFNGNIFKLDSLTHSSNMLDDVDKLLLVSTSHEHYKMLYIGINQKGVNIYVTDDNPKQIYPMIGFLLKDNRFVDIYGMV